MLCFCKNCFPFILISSNHLSVDMNWNQLGLGKVDGHVHTWVWPAAFTFSYYKPWFYLSYSRLALLTLFSRRVCLSLIEKITKTFSYFVFQGSIWKEEVILWKTAWTQFIETLNVSVFQRMRFWKWYFIATAPFCV